MEVRFSARVTLASATVRSMHEALFSEFNASEGRSSKLPFTFSNVRGTSEAGAFGVYLLGFRKPDLSLRLPARNLDLHDDLCEDMPAWWLLKKKKTMYHTGRRRRPFGAVDHAVHADAADNSPSRFRESTSQRSATSRRTLQHSKRRSIRCRSTRPGRQGREALRRELRSCHGTYGEKWTYPNKIVPLDEIGTDPNALRRDHREVRRAITTELVRPREEGLVTDGLPSCRQRATRRRRSTASGRRRRTSTTARRRRSITCSTRRRGRRYSRAPLKQNGGLRFDQGGLEDTEVKGDRAQEAAIPLSGGRSTTLINRAGATAATPSATTWGMRSDMAVIEYLKTL